jgi:hypothetical protein
MKEKLKLRIKQNKDKADKDSPQEPCEGSIIPPFSEMGHSF